MPIARYTRASVQDSKRSHGSPDFFVLFWVEYILTTTNRCKTPIKDFGLTVECPRLSVTRIGADQSYVSSAGQEHIKGRPPNNLWRARPISSRTTTLL